MKKISTIILITLLCTLLLTGCFGSSAENTEKYRDPVEAIEKMIESNGYENQEYNYIIAGNYIICYANGGIHTGYKTQDGYYTFILPNDYKHVVFSINEKLESSPYLASLYIINGEYLIRINGYSKERFSFYDNTGEQFIEFERTCLKTMTEIPNDYELYCRDNGKTTVILTAEEISKWEK